MLIEKQMIVAEMRATHVPVKILGLQIERENIRQDRIQRAGDVLGCRRLEIGRRGQRRLLPALELLPLRRREFFHGYDGFESWAACGLKKTPRADPEPTRPGSNRPWPWQDS